MRIQTRQLDAKKWPVTSGPLAVTGEHKNRDGPLIYRLRDGPSCVTGPPRVAGLPVEAGPIRNNGPAVITGSQHNTGSLKGHGPPFKQAHTGIEQDSTKVTGKQQNLNLKREDTKMCNSKLIRLLSLAFVGCVSALQMSAVYAAAGDTISNRATLTFDVGGTPTVLESSLAGNTTTGVGNGTDTDFTEDRLINFSVATVDVATVQVSPSATLQVQTFTVTNNGNDAQDFLLTAVNSSGGADPFGGNADSFDATASVFVDSGLIANPADVYSSATDTDIFVDELAAGTSRTVYIVSTIPGAVVDAQVAVLSLVAQVAVGGAASANDALIANAGAEITNDNNGNISPAGTFGNPGQQRVTLAGTANDVADVVGGAAQNVFNDPAGATAVDVDSTGASQDVVQNGQHSDSSSYTVSAAILTVTKTSSVLWDPINGGGAGNPKAIPGAYVQYVVTIANTGTGSGDLTTLQDILTSTDLDPDLILATATTPVPGVVVGVDIENAVGDSIRVDTSGTARGVPVAGTYYCTGSTGDVDGCGYVGGIGGTLTIDFTSITAMPAEDVAPAGAGSEDYAAGELKSGESVVFVFNAVVQ